MREPLVHTFSIVARDPETGQFGVGVQSHWFAVGSVVPWTTRGVGAVATQAHAKTAYGRLGLNLMQAGMSAKEALSALLAADDDRAIRQVAMIDKHGRVAAFTGEQCIEHAGHLTGDGFSVQGNLLASPDVWPAMAEAYLGSAGEDFSERLLEALEAGQDAGGDVRGRQSAALLVVPGPNDEMDRNDPLTDLRVDDGDRPLVEMRRLLTVQRGYEWHEQAIHAISVGNIEHARDIYEKLRGLVVGTREPLFWYATALAEHGYVEESLPVFTEVFRVEPVWRELLDRLADAGSFPPDPVLIERIRLTC